jgi:signal transduction histidine kinase/ActR/RegA family two-component response regulator
MLGYTAAEVVGKVNPSDIHDLDEVMARAEALSTELATTIAPGFEALACKASRGLEDVYELTYIRKDGSRFPAIVSIAPLSDPAGKLIGYLLLGANDSVSTRIELKLTNAKTAAEKKSLAKSDFLVHLSHELRTPLNVILGFAQLMETGFPPPPASQKENLNQILKAGSYLLALTNQLLDLALIESGTVSLSVEPVSLAEVMLECRAMVEAHAKKRSIRLLLPQFDMPCFVNADRTGLIQVLVNFLLNAIKYNRLGGTVTVECSVSPSSADSIRINVEDTGKGLAPEQLALLFQPFNRLGDEFVHDDGTGLGLVVSKQLVKLMGGATGAHSTIGIGSVFWIDLSLTTAPPAGYLEATRAAPLRAPLDGVSRRAMGHTRTVLYVEDNAANLELIKQLVARRPNLRLLCTTDATRGIASARANLPDVILMDINLPGMSGIDAMKMLRADPSTAHIPIIALSANAMPRDIEKGIEAGFFNYVTKPIRVNEFMEALDVALDFSRSA